ncbi:MAG: hypothetical protein JW894_03525 [Bacteroidales bacterium]|nr:hypothetical protein [Bacteroidales bacterium]
MNIDSNALIKSSNIENSDSILMNSDFQNITESCSTYLDNKGFNDYNTVKVLSLTKDRSVTSGIRNLWLKDHEIYSIQIKEHKDFKSAETESENIGRKSYSPVCLVNIEESIDNAIGEWINKWSRHNSMHYISVIGIMGNISIHFYHYSESSINIESFEQLIKSINAGGQL